MDRGYGGCKSPIVYSDSPVLSQQALAAQSDRPVVDEFAPVGSDIAPMPQAAVGQPAAGKGRLVKVETPVLEVWIDLLGGDIARVQLPTYPFP